MNVVDEIQTALERWQETAETAQRRLKSILPCSGQDVGVGKTPTPRRNRLANLQFFEAILNATEVKELVAIDDYLQSKYRVFWQRAQDKRSACSLFTEFELLSKLIRLQKRVLMGECGNWSD